MRDHRIRRAREAKPLLLSGLRRLEYRGYDSAGIALREDDGLDYVRAVGNLQNLSRRRRAERLASRRHGLGHTRWATHGGVTEQNAHPLAGCDASKLAIVLNGIVENYRELRGRARRRAGTRSRPRPTPKSSRTCSSASTTATSCRALIRVYPRLEGHFTIVAIHHDHPDLLVGVRRQTPLVVGLGEGENFLASNVAAFLSETRRAVVPGRRRGRRDHAGRRALPQGRRRGRASRGRGARLGRRGRREGRLRDVHAEGDLRAARGGARDDRRPRARPRS